MSGLRGEAGPGSGPGAGAFELLARRLAGEFGAPVGLLDPRRGAWLAHAGAEASAFPAIRPGLKGAAVRGRAALWSGGGPTGRRWLIVPVEGPAGALVAVAGFATPGEGLCGRSSPRWGPPCPAPALLAWGESVAARLRRGGPPPGPAPGPPTDRTPPRAEPVAPGGDRQLVARLIRRLRVSDPPGRFQQLAADALRAAMGVQAVAWVPPHPAEPVVACGEVGRLKGEKFRALAPDPGGTAAVVVANRPATPPDPAVARVLAVAADGRGESGWLVAVNPLDGRRFAADDGDPLRPVASLIATQRVNARVYADLKDLLFGVIRSLTAAVDAKDPYTSGHSERVARIAVRLGLRLGLSPNQQGDLYLMGLLHDVGKIGVHDAVLKKPGPLTPEEYREVQRHVDIGVHILADLRKLHHLLPGVRHHHESLDGSGYPSGLSGDAIPFEARILAVADSFDAMSSTRPYRHRLPPDRIDAILREGAGVQWDPRIIEALFCCRADLDLIRQKGLGESLHVAVCETLGRG